jgi:predicted nucleotidyltransferase
MNNNENPKTLTDNLASNSKYQSENQVPAKTPEEQSKEFEKLKKKLEDFKKKVLKKFSFTKALAVLPANASPIFEEDEQLPKEIIDTKPLHLFMIIPEDKFKDLNKIKSEVIQIVKDSKENLWIHIKTAEVDLWNYGLDSKYEFIDAISASFPLHDTGILGALRVANIHKTLVLNWLNTGRVRYVATYAIGGSLVRGTADNTSDVDTFVIIDDTDVKRMSRVELLDKLRRRITYDFIKEATALAGVKNILNVQVYLLTDFWQSVKDAQPVMFTFIRDGIPLYDKGTFTPWKRLLQMGRIKPSPEAIDLYMKEGERTDELIKRRMLDAMVDIYFGVVTPTQAMMMLAGHAPPVPKTIVKEVEDVLVKKEKVMSPIELKILDKVVKLYKDYEHGTLKEIPGKEIDNLLKESKEYTKKMKELREKLEQKMHGHQAEKIQKETFDLMKKILGEKKPVDLIKALDSSLVKKGKIKERMLPIAKEIANLKKKSKDKKFSTTEMQRLTRDASELNDSLTEYAQRKDLTNIEKSVIHISYNDKKAELVLTHSGAFIADQSGKLWKIEHSDFKESNKTEFETALKETKKSEKPSLTNEILEALKKHLGDYSINL